MAEAGYSTLQSLPEWASRLYLDTKAGAKRRDLPFTITEAQFLALCVASKGRCSLTGIPFSLRRSCSRRPFVPSVDRIDSAKGYVKGNVRLVACCVNIALGEWGEPVFRAMAEGYLMKYPSQIELWSEDAADDRFIDPSIAIESNRRRRQWARYSHYYLRFSRVEEAMDPSADTAAVRRMKERLRPLGITQTTTGRHRLGSPVFLRVGDVVSEALRMGLLLGDVSDPATASRYFSRLPLPRYGEVSARGTQCSTTGDSYRVHDPLDLIGR